MSGAAAFALVACGGGGGETPTPAATETITAVLTGDQEAPASVNTGATGSDALAGPCHAHAER